MLKFKRYVISCHMECYFNFLKLFYIKNVKNVPFASCKKQPIVHLRIPHFMNVFLSIFDPEQKRLHLKVINMKTVTMIILHLKEIESH